MQYDGSGLNLYNYLLNNAINGFDSYGLCCVLYFTVIDRGRPSTMGKPYNRMEKIKNEGKNFFERYPEDLLGFQTRTFAPGQQKEAIYAFFVVIVMDETKGECNVRLDETRSTVEFFRFVDTPKGTAEEPTNKKPPGVWIAPGKNEILTDRFDVVNEYWRQRGLKSDRKFRRLVFFDAPNTFYRPDLDNVWNEKVIGYTAINHVIQDWSVEDESGKAVYSKTLKIDVSIRSGELTPE